MKKIIVTIAKVLLLIAPSFAQSQKFDIATYIPPQGWQQLDSNGKRGFFDFKSDGSSTRFCQILMYPSHQSSGNAKRDFDEEWNNRIIKATGYTKKPATQTKRSPDGWTVITGSANIPQQGTMYTCILTCYSGFGKEMSVLTNIAGQEYLPNVDQFFKNFVLDKNASIAGNETTSITKLGDASGYIFTTPVGWNAISYPDGIVLSAPVSNTGEKCNITLWPMRSSTGNLQTDAANLFASVFKDFDRRTGSTPNSMIRGISPQGWEYFIIKNAIALRGGDFQTMFGFAFVAKSGSQVAAISGISKDPLVSSCFGLQLTDVWPKFFYSLAFKNLQTASQQSQLVNRLTGVWMAVTASAGDRFVFASNGRFAGAAAAQRYVRLSSTELLQITDAYFGDGAYVISGNGISLIHDSDKNNPEKAWFRIEQESTNGGASWQEKLYLLRRSTVDSSEYELAYDKQ